MQREQEVDAWAQLALERAILVAVVYGVMLVIVAFCFYLCMLWGVLFTPQQTRSWLAASFISFALDALISEPAI